MRTTALLLLAFLLVSGCGPSRKVERVGANTVTDLSGKWNDTDSKQVAKEMIDDVLSRPWYQNWTNEHTGKLPVVKVMTIKNKSTEHINTETFTKSFERELINSGKVEFVAENQFNEELREELAEQEKFSSEETQKEMMNETGADFALMGTINSIVDQWEGQKAVFYKTNLELIDMSTHKKVWIGDKEIKKVISQRGSKL